MKRILKQLAFVVLVLTGTSWPGAAQNGAKGGGLVKPPGQRRPVVKISADNYWHVNTPGKMRLDTSGLVLKEGKLLTVGDAGPELFWIELADDHQARAVPAGWFGRRQLEAVSARPRNKFDCEGLAQDREGNIYLCEEEQRAIFKYDAKSKKVEHLAIDWASAKKYFSGDANASFEGIAIGGGKLWVANERNDARILCLDFKTLKLEKTFFVDSVNFAFGGPHYSDLSWWGERLWVLDRNHRVILEVDAETKKAVAEYNFAEMELDPAVAHKTLYPTGTMEGLAVEQDWFWLITDNNGLPRMKDSKDIRPTLFRCRRPVVDQQTGAPSPKDND